MSSCDKKTTFESTQIDLNSSEPVIATSQLDVDWALEQVAKPGWHPVTETLLAEEVTRLRTELVFAKPLFSRRQLEEKLARVEALVVDWRERDQGDWFPRESAAELEAALKGAE